MTVADDLTTARDIVAQHWFKGGITDGEGNVCAMGAVNVAVWGSPHVNVNSEYNRRAAALDALADHLPAPFTSIPAFNDDADTRLEDVLNLFEKTLADIGGL